jgi:hypothetical protein
VKVVVPQPSVKGGGAFGAGTVDGAVGPAAQEGADEPLSYAVGFRLRLRSIRSVSSEASV